MRMGAYSRWALIRGWALIIFISLEVFFFFFHSLFTFLFLNKLLYLLWTVTAIFVFVIDNFAHVVLLTFDLFFVYLENKTRSRYGSLRRSY